MQASGGNSSVLQVFQAQKKVSGVIGAQVASSNRVLSSMGWGAQRGGGGGWGQASQVGTPRGSARANTWNPVVHKGIAVPVVAKHLIALRQQDTAHHNSPTPRTVGVQMRGGGNGLMGESGRSFQPLYQTPPSLSGPL